MVGKATREAGNVFSTGLEASKASIAATTSPTGPQSICEKDIAVATLCLQGDMASRVAKADALHCISWAFIWSSDLSLQLLDRPMSQVIVTKYDVKI